MGAKRLEALTDGVFAIAMTLLVIEITVPVVSELSAKSALAYKLLEMWPQYISYGISFIILGLFWLHNHSLFSYIKRTDGRLFGLTLVFLMFIAFIPFSSSLAAEHWNEQIAAIVYGCNWLIPFLLNFLIFTHITGKANLVDNSLEPSFIKNERKSSILLAISIIAGILVSFIHPVISFIIYGVLAIFYIGAILLNREGISASKDI